MPNFTVPRRVFDPTFAERVRDANPLEQVVNGDLLSAGHRALTGTGDERAGWHPSHGSSSGCSLTVHVVKELWHCFNCGEGGDVFKWVMSNRGSTFVEALHYLADRAGIPLPSLDPTQQQQWQQLQQERHDLEQLFRAAGAFFHQQLTQEHIDVCKTQWGLTLETIQRYMLGFAPAVPDALQQHLRGQGFAEEALQKSGLVIQVGSRWHDFFQGRIVFPYWRDLPHAHAGLFGTPLYFIGRRLKGTTPDVTWEKAKYRKQLVHGAKHPYVSPTVLNTYFYGEHALRGLQDRPLLVTEEVADCFVVLQSERPAISPATVRFSKACYPRLLKLAHQVKRILICNDNEANETGAKGALATAAFLDAEGIDVRLVQLPRPDGVETMDLAAFLQHQSVEDFQQLCEEARSYLDTCLAQYPVSTDDFTNCQTARQVVEEVLRQYPDEQKALAFLRYRVKKHFALQKLDIDDLMMAYRTLRKASTAGASSGSSQSPQTTTGPQNTPTQHEAPLVESGRYLLYPYGLYMENGADPQTGEPILIPLTNFGAQITGQTTRDDGSGELKKTYEITATVQKQCMHCSVPAKDYNGMNWVAQELGAEAILTAGSRLKDCAREAIQRCSKNLVHRYVYEHTGWRLVNGERCYLHNGGAITARGPRDDISVELSGSLARYQLPPPPTGDPRRAAIRTSLALQGLLPDGGIIPILGTVYLPPLRELLPTEPPDFTLWVHGRSGLFKSEIAALAQSHWGDFSRTTLPASFVATGNALERLTFATKDALLCCDDYFPARNKREADAMDQAAARLLRGVGNGSGRPRMRQDTTMRPDLPPRGMALATAERLPDGVSTNARVFLLALTPITQDDIARRLTQAQESKQHYPLAMSAYIQWIAEHWDRLLTTLLTRFRELRQKAYAPRNHSRQASQVAYLYLAWEVFTEFAVDVGALDTETCTTLLQEAWEVLVAIARQQSTVLQDDAPERRFLTLLADGFASKRGYLENLHGDCPADGDAWGWVRVTRHDRDGNEYEELQRPAQGTLLGHAGEAWLYLFPDQAYQFVAKAAREANGIFPVESKTLLKHLGDAGYIATTKEGGDVRRTYQVRIRSRKIRVLKLRRTALTEVSPEITGDTPAPGTRPGTENQSAILGTCDENNLPVPDVPGNGHLESHIHAHDAHHTYDTHNHDEPIAAVRDSLPSIGYTGDNGDTQHKNSRNTALFDVPGNTTPTGNTGDTGDRAQTGSCTRCGANPRALVHRQGRPACVGCALLSDDEVSRRYPSGATNGAPSPSLETTTPCIVCGQTVRWDDQGTLRCIACWPPDQMKWVSHPIDGVEG